MPPMLIPVALAAYAWRLLPWVCCRYRLTNRRVVVQHGLRPTDSRAIALDVLRRVASRRATASARRARTRPTVAKAPPRNSAASTTAVTPAATQ